MKNLENKIKPHNSRDEYKEFKNSKQLYKYIKENNIELYQDFYFIVDGEDILFCKLYEYEFCG